MTTHPTGQAGSADIAQQARMDLLLAEFPLVNDHPDVAGLLRSPAGLAVIGAALAEPFRNAGVTVVCAPEARGPILGALVAVELGVGLVLVRKAPRNHPGADRHYVVGPTWRGTNEEFQARSDDLSSDDRVLAVDDWITTGSTLRAIRTYVDSAGAEYAGATVLVDKTSDAVRAELGVQSLLDFEAIMGRG